MLDAVCTYVSLDDIMSRKLNARCGKLAVRFYRPLKGKQYFARCKEHDKPGDNPSREAAQEVSWEEFVAYQVMES